MNAQSNVIHGPFDSQRTRIHIGHSTDVLVDPT